MMSEQTDWKVQPLTTERWPDLEQLFGLKGACGGCWCMWWRLPRKVFYVNLGEGNRCALRELSQAEPSPGLVGYMGDEPVAWCALGPREVYPVLERSRVLKRMDDQPVWSVVCFFVAKRWRHHGLTVRLLNAACEYAARHHALIVEGYPVEPTAGKIPADAFVYTGLASAFIRAGFVEVARRSPTRPVMHFSITQIDEIKENQNAD
ncbi:MAG: GNAT family N-acetyltransferase [Anaerolineae bacterium]